ncbi:MAG: hypothetical protein FD163_1810 [Hyphomonadaceae bacterium]|nr:MAG: hypothetical protein FD128_1955 [Hyphomonadaceae bacterium]KAF0184236.1 MAG: hypothetical protein FD163_1810 [Hyphomonadaceae bacterium]
MSQSTPYDPPETNDENCKFENWYNANALKIWSRCGEKKEFPRQTLMPSFLSGFDLNYPDLSIGMNPSFSKSALNERVRQETKWEGDAITLFEYSDEKPDNMKERINSIKELEKNSKNKYTRFFGPITDVFKACGGENYNHLDLFLVRETNQKDATDILTARNGEFFPFSQFGKVQFDLLKEAIDRLIKKGNLERVLVANAKVANLLLNSDFNPNRLDKPIGLNPTHFVYENIPFFLSGMLSSGNTDGFAKTRLINEMKSYPPTIPPSLRRT